MKIKLDSFWWGKKLCDRTKFLKYLIQQKFSIIALCNALTQSEKIISSKNNGSAFSTNIIKMSSGIYENFSFFTIR